MEKQNQNNNEVPSKAENKQKKLFLVIAAIVVIIAVAATAIIIAASNAHNSSTDKSTADSAVQETTKEPEFVKLVEDKDTFLIDLDFVKLRYPNNLKDSVTITGAEKHASTDKFSLSFSAGDTKLFELYFNDEQESLLGTLPLENNPVIIYVKTFPLGTESIDLLEKQESLNVIIQGLISDYGFLPGEIEQEEDNTVYEIKTAVVSLFYPNKWKDRVTVTEKDKTVSFTDGTKPLFDLRFEECDGYLLGTYDGTPIYMVEYPVENEDQMAMQQDVNVIINHLREDKKFQMND